MSRRRQGPNSSRIMPRPNRVPIDCDPDLLDLPDFPDLPDLEAHRGWFGQPMARIIADLQRLAADLEDWDRVAGTEATVALHDAVHTLRRAIFAAQELDAAAGSTNYAEQWIG